MCVRISLGNEDVNKMIREHEKKILGMEKLLTTQNEMIVNQNKKIAGLNKEISELKTIVASKSDKMEQLKEATVIEKERRRSLGNVHFIHL